jgi:hypothetical protein
MRGIKRPLTVLAVIGTALALAPAAGAQEEVTPKFSLGGTSFGINTAFTATITEGTCPGGPVSLTSPGFASPADLETLYGRFGSTAGTYTATLKCKDTAKEGTVTFELTAPVPRQEQFLDKEEYAPGEAINIFLERGYKCGFEGAVSEGFTAPAQLKQSRPGDHGLTGQTTAVATPGTYQATIKCLSWSVADTFTVKAPATPPPGTPAPKPQRPIVKPKGAPETGGGGTA